MINLPPEILTIILNNLDLVSLINAKQTCKYLCQLSCICKYQILLNELKETNNPVLVSVKYGDLQLTKCLVKKNNFNKWNKGLYIAIEINNADLINYFVKQGANKYVKAMNKTINLYGLESKLSKYFYELIINKWDGCHHCDTILRPSEIGIFNSGVTKIKEYYGVLLQCSHCDNITVLT